MDWKYFSESKAKLRWIPSLLLKFIIIIQSLRIWGLVKMFVNVYLEERYEYSWKNI